MTNLGNAESRNKAVFLPDQSIKHASEDKLNLVSYVDVIERIIGSCKTPINIGLFGKWGVGKSSILNLLEERVLKHGLSGKQYDFFSIDAWKLSKESLRQQLIIDLNKHYGQKVFKEEEIEDVLFNITEVKLEEERKESVWEKIKDLPNVLKQNADYVSLFLAIFLTGLVLKPLLQEVFNITYSYLEVLFTSFLIPLLPAILEKIDLTGKITRVSAKKIIPRVEYPHQFERMFKKILEQRGNKTLIIAIDNLDRCSDEVVVDMLGITKNFMNIPGCIFILACDDEAIEKHLHTRMGLEQKDAKEFLRKFFHAPIKILPFLDEDLNIYMDKMMKEQGANFGEEVKEVLMSATTKNPRRVKQFLNSLMSTYCLAERNENNSGSIRKGIVTGNSGFLAKIVVIRDEWPEFYKALVQQEDLLINIEKDFRGETLEGIGSNNIKEYFRKNEGLEWFLRATRTIETADISPFLKLSQESYERTLPEHEAFTRRVEFGEYKVVLEILQNLDKVSLRNYLKEILKTIDKSIKRNRFNSAFNALNVSSEIFTIVPSDIKPEFIKRFEKHACNKQIMQNLAKFTSGNLFKILNEMRPNYRNSILISYCDLLIQGKVFNNELLDLFVINRNILTNQIINKINDQLIEAYTKDYIDLLRILDEKIIMNPDIKKLMIKQKMISTIVESIDRQVSIANEKRIQSYYSLKDMASQSNKTHFIEKMLSILSLKEIATIDKFIEFALEKLEGLEPNDIPEQITNELYTTVIKYGSLMANESHKLQFFEVILSYFKIFDQEKKNNFIEHNLLPLVKNGSQKVVMDIVNISTEKELPVLEYDSIITALIQRALTNLPTKELVDYLITETPDAKKELVGNMLIKMVQSNNTGLLSIALESFQQNLNCLSPMIVDKIAKTCLNVGKAKSPEQMGTFFDPIVASYDAGSDEFRNIFADQILTQMKDDNLNLRKIGIKYYEALNGKIPDYKRKYILGQLILKLGSLQDRIDSSAKLLIDVILKDQNLLERDDSTRFIDILIGQLVTTKGEETQIIGLKSLQQMEKLYYKSSLVLMAISDLSKSGSSKIRDVCKDVLETFKNRYKGPKGFWEEMERFFKTS